MTPAKKTRPDIVAKDSVTAKKRAAHSGSKKETAISPETQAVMETWRTEVAGLRERTFLSVEDATEALVEKVVARLKLPASPDLQQFLTDIILTDESIREEVERSLVKHSGPG